MNSNVNCGNFDDSIAEMDRVLSEGRFAEALAGYCGLLAFQSCLVIEPSLVTHPPAWQDARVALLLYRRGLALAAIAKYSEAVSDYAISQRLRSEDPHPLFALVSLLCTAPDKTVRSVATAASLLPRVRRTLSLGGSVSALALLSEALVYVSQSEFHKASVLLKSRANEINEYHDFSELLCAAENERLIIREEAEIGRRVRIWISNFVEDTRGN